MRSTGSLLYDIDCSVYRRLFPDSLPFAFHSTCPDNTQLSRELEDVFHEKYTTSVENSAANSLYPYHIFVRVAKGMSISPFDSMTSAPPLMPTEFIRLVDDEFLSLVEAWTIIGLLYLIAQEGKDFEESSEALRLQCRIPQKTHQMLIQLVTSRDWNVAMEDGQLRLDDSFCEELEKLITKIVKPEMTRIIPLKGLQAKSYQNTADRAILKKISMLPGVSKLIGRIINTLKRQQELFLLANQQMVTPQSHPRLYKLFWMAVQILDIEDLPILYIDSSLPGINAYTTGTDKKAYIAISSQAVLLLDDRELLYILGHELGHIQCDHVRYHALADVLLDSSTYIPVIGPLLSAVSKPILMPLLAAWLRYSELSADRAGLLCCQCREAVLRTMMKMGGHPWNLYHLLRTRTLIDQTMTFLKAREQSKLDRMFDLFNRLYATHPYLIYRASELLLWLQNAEYDEHVNTDEQGRISLGLRVLDDAQQQTILKEVEQFVVDWHMEHGVYLRKVIAKDVRKMIYDGICPTSRPLNSVGRIVLDIEQISATDFTYACTFYTVNDKKEIISVSRELNIDQSRDEAPAFVRAEFLKNGGNRISRVLYELK